jgi:HAD superfamily hydrolase (TIGR01509 family)
MAVRGIILDVDGTLVDSNDAHTQAWVDALRAHGFEADFNQIRRLVGMGGDNLLPSAIGVEKDTEVGKKISETRGEIFKSQYLPKVKPFAHVPDLLKRMREAGLTVVAGSSAQPEELDQLLDIAGAKELVQAVTSAGDAENSKPDPDIVQAALEKMGLSPDEALMMGDTPYDIEAALLASVPDVPQGSWMGFTLELQQSFHRLLWDINHKVGLRRSEVEYAVVGLGEVCQSFIHMAMKERMSGRLLPAFEFVYQD